MRHSRRAPEPELSLGRTISSRKRRELRWIFAVIFAGNLALQPLAARQIPFGPQQVIATLTSGFDAAFAADLDGDGDLDALVADSGVDEVSWFENTDGLGNFGPQRVISTDEIDPYHVAAADVEGDGDLDVVSVSIYDDTIAWYENTDGLGSFGPQQIISTLVDNPYEAWPVDLDGDGDLDLLSGSAYDDKVAWYENTDGAGAFGPQQVISTAGDRPQSVWAADLDGDGDLDALAASFDDDILAWYPNLGPDNGSGPCSTVTSACFGSQQSISSLADGAFLIRAADLDGDGDLDAVSTSFSDDELAWYENSDGAGTFGTRQVVGSVTNSTALFAEDLDGDGDLDLLSADRSGGMTLWFENTDGSGGFSSGQMIFSSTLLPTETVAADLDGDGDLDVLVAGNNNDSLEWYENETIHRSALFPQRVVIGTAADLSFPVAAADLDGDGDLDAVMGFGNDDGLAWSASDGSGGFGSLQTLATGQVGRELHPADIDGDGDLDVVTAQGSVLSWVENTDGAGSFAAPQAVSGTPNIVETLVTADLDGDGHLDLVVGRNSSVLVAWHPNTDGSGSFPTEVAISTLGATLGWVAAADLDRDGDLDVLSVTDTIAWYENDGSGGFGSQVIITGTAYGPRQLSLGDIDGDGDLDVVSIGGEEDNNETLWIENLGGGTFGTEQVVAQLGALGVEVADLDSDGDLDILSGGAPPAWSENTDGDGGFSPPQTLLSSSLAPVFGLDVGDLDRDGDLDVLAIHQSSEQAVTWYENKGGQFSLATVDVTQGVVADNELHDLLKITVTHEGRTGDSAVELSGLELQFDNGGGTSLSEAGMDARFAGLRLYLDDGAESDVFDSADTMVASTTDFSSAGVGLTPLTWTLPDDDSNLQVPFGSPRTYFLVAELSASTSAFDVEHLTENSSTGDDAPNDIPLILEFAANVQSAEVDTTLSTATCNAPFDLQLTDRTVSGTVTCEAGTVLTTETNVVVTGTGDLTLRAGQQVELEDGLEVQSGGDFTVDVDDTLEP